MPTALVQGRIAVQFEDLLRGQLDKNWKINVWDPAKNHPDEFSHLAYEADVIIGGRIPMETWPEVPKLKLFQIPWTGYDFCSPSSMPAGIPVCNCFEHESSIAEYVLCGMLESKIGLRHIDKRFRKEGWGGRQPGTSLYHGEIRGRMLGIVGYGHIGAEVAKRALAFQMRVVGIRRSKHPTPPQLEWLGDLKRLNELLRICDFVVIACDLNDDTEGLIGVQEIAEMKKDSILINVARGRVVDEEALFNALKKNQIGGAVIDVWYNYIGQEKVDVWPSSYPFETLENVILSAHESASSPEQVDRRWKFVAENVKLVARGRKPRNKVFEGTQKLK